MHGPIVVRPPGTPAAYVFPAYLYMQTASSIDTGAHR